MHYTGKPRDTETNLDYFGARYFSSGMGRWMSPDWADKPTEVPYANFGDPQSLNLYSYVGNNPLTKADKDGHCPPCEAYADSLLTGLEESPAAQTITNALGVTFTAIATAGTGLAGKAEEVLADAGAKGTMMGQYGDQTKQGSVPVQNANGSSGQTGSSPGGMAPKPGQSGGPGQGKDFKKGTKEEGLQENKEANGGQAKCVFCGEPVGEGTGNKINFDHANAKANGGNNSKDNLNVTCEYCNKSKGTGDAPKNPKIAQ